MKMMNNMMKKLI